MIQKTTLSNAFYALSQKNQQDKQQVYYINIIGTFSSCYVYTDRHRQTKATCYIKDVLMAKQQTQNKSDLFDYILGLTLISPMVNKVLLY